MDVNELKAEAADKRKEAHAIKAKADKEKRKMAADEIGQVNALLDEADDKEAQAAKLEADEADARAKADAAEARLKASQTHSTASAQVIRTPVQGSETTSISTRDRIEDDPMRGFSGLGDFSAAVYRAAHGTPDSRIGILAAAGSPTMQQGVATDGGVLVPPAFSQTIYEGVTASGVGRIIGLCDTYTLPYGVESMTFPADAETSRADGSRAGGIRGYWKSELGQMTESRPTFREVKLEPKELYVFVYASDKLLRNAPMLEQYMSRKAIEEIRFKVEDAIINGTGSGQPKGIMPSACTVDVAKDAGQDADTITRTNIQGMWQRLLPQAQARGVWLYDQSCSTQLSSITLPVGTGGVPLMMPAGGLSGAPYGTIFGRPAMPSEYCGAVGDNGDLIFADFGAYALALRGGVQSAMSIHLKFDFNQTAFRFLFEVDGQPWLASAITPFTPSGGTTKTETLSTFAAIAARA